VWDIANSTINNESEGFRALFGDIYTTLSHDDSGGLFENYVGQSVTAMFSGVRDYKNDNTIRLISNHEVSQGYSYRSISLGVYLVSDGGTTLSSQMDPSINANNVNYVAADVSAPALLGLMGLGLLGFAARRRL
jgi:hypothetical protein